MGNMTRHLTLMAIFSISKGGFKRKASWFQRFSTREWVLGKASFHTSKCVPWKVQVFLCALQLTPKFKIRGLSLGWPRQFVFLQIHQANCCWMGDSRPHPSWFTSSQSWLHLTIGWLLFGWDTPQQGQGTVRRMTFSQSRTELAPPG